MTAVRHVCYTTKKEQVRSVFQVIQLQIVVLSRSVETFFEKLFVLTGYKLTCSDKGFSYDLPSMLLAYSNEYSIQKQLRMLSCTVQPNRHINRLSLNFLPYISRK